MALASPEELAQIVGVESARDWAGVSDNAWARVDGALGGVKNLRVLANMPASLFRDAIEPLNLTPIEKTASALMWRVARQKLGLADEDPIKEASVIVIKESASSVKAAPVTSSKERMLSPVWPGSLGLNKPSGSSTLGFVGVSYLKGMKDLNTFYLAGCDGAIEVPKARWDHSLYYDYSSRNDLDRSKPTPFNGGWTIFMRHANFVEGVEAFDHTFFNVTAKEAKHLPMAHKLSLKAAMKAFASAKLTRQSVSGAPVGVFAGTMNYDTVISQGNVKPIVEVTSMASQSHLANRVSHAFGLTGPSQFIETGCSSGATCTDIASQNVRRGRCSLGLAISMTRMDTPVQMNVCTTGNMSSPWGRSSVLDKTGLGYSIGEGYGAMLLGWVDDKTLRTPVLMGSVTRQDGKGAQFMAPNGPSQQNLIKDAHRESGRTTHDMQAFEMAANGSQLGDPIETGSVSMVFSRNAHQRMTPLVLTLGKANKGHGEGFSGITSLTKTINSMIHEVYPPAVHLAVLNENVDLDGFPSVLVHECVPMFYEKEVNVGVSSFGYGGVNVHFVVSVSDDRVQQQS